MSKLEGLLFDVDGTLADTERDGHRVAFNKAFTKAGLDWHWSIELYGELLSVTGGKERIRHYITQKRKGFNTANLDDLIIELHQSKTVFYNQLLSTGKIPLRPGVKRLIKQAYKSGLRLAIVTTTTPENVYTLFEHALDTRAIQWFDVIAAGDIVENKKPAPDIYFHALKELDLPAERCMAFEDSHNGLRSSVQAGLKTVVVVNGYTYAHDFTGACAVLDHFGEPDRSFTVITGDAGKSRYLDIELLTTWHGLGTCRV